MNIFGNYSHFNQQLIEDFDERKDIKNWNNAYRVSSECYADENFFSKLEMFLKAKNISKITNIIIGAWNTEEEENVQGILDRLIKKKDRLQHIKGFFIGDISIDENEISWIEQGNYEVFLNAFPNIEVLHIKGACNLTFKTIDHKNLKELKIISAGLASNIFEEISKANLPNLETLELWLGIDSHGFTSSAKEVLQIVQLTNLPKLKHLGLLNSEITDTLAENLIEHPILKKLESLDFSLGNMSDKGAQFLFENILIEKLQKLRIEYHFISDDWIKKLQSLNLNVSLSGKQKNDHGYRYIALGE